MNVRSLSLCLALLLPACLSQSAQPSDPAMERYMDIRQEMELLVNTRGTDAALERFAAMLDDPLVAGICHGLAHEIGHAAYERYGFEASLSFEDDV